MEPMSQLLKKDTTWVWEKPQQKAFEEVKKAIASATTLAYYDPNRPTIVSSDASSYGLGGVLMQEDKEGKRRPIAYVSRTMTDAERRYAQIEKELLGVVWTCERFARYLVGLNNFKIITDHKPLVPIINDKELDIVPIRCQRLLIRLMRYHGKATHVPGKSLVLADQLSRKPIVRKEGKDELEEEVEAYVQCIMNTMPASQPKMQQIAEESSKDPVIKKTRLMIENGWPDVHKISQEIKEMYHVRGNLSIVDDIIMYGNRLVIPKSMQEEMLERIHRGHHGITKSRMRAQEAVWWPGISKD